MSLTERNFKPNLLCIAPPYGNRPAAGSAYLLGYLKSKGCSDFDFLDLRLGAPFDFTPTYRTTGTFGESYVLDTPDLPLALMLLRSYREGAPLAPKRSPLFEQYCVERSISVHYLEGYLASLDRYYEECFGQLGRLDIVGFSTWTPNYLSTLMAAAHLKRRKNPPVILAGGPQVSASRASAEMGLRSGLFDAVFVGEAEESLHEFVCSHRKGHGIPRGIAGVKTLNSADGTIEYEDRRQMRMEVIPTPSFDEMSLTSYQNEEQYRSLPYQLSRGCTDKCSFCSEWVFWKHYRSDTPDHAVGQIRELIKRYNANFIEFSDSLLNGHPRRLTAFAEQVLKEDLRFGWTSFMRAQIDPEAARLVRRSGCTGVFIGIESFSDEALAIMNKRRTEAENIQAICSFVEAGIHVTAGFIPGFPGDSRRGFMHSLSVLRDLQDKYPGRIELHEEPFTVMANAPMIANLAAVGLQPKGFAPEYLDIEARYADLTSKVHCSVEGSAQGLERIGRTKLVGAVKTDAPVKGSFDEGFDDVISLHQFEFEHMYGGWYLASKKTRTGHRFGLLVNDEEHEEMLALQDEYFPLDTLHDAVRDKIAEYQARHLAAIPLDAPRVVRALYRKELTEGCVLTLSPFFLARSMGWRHKEQVLAVDTVSGRVHRLGAANRAAITALASGPRTPGALWNALGDARRAYRGEEAFRRGVRSLIETGLVVVCEATPEVELREADPCAAEISALISELDDWQTMLYPRESCHLDSPELLREGKTDFIAAYVDGAIAGCGAVKLGSEWGEIKRMFVRPEFRRCGLGAKILEKLETIARREGKAVVRIETGVRSSEALALYRSQGFREADPFPPYLPDPLSVFLEKPL